MIIRLCSLATATENSKLPPTPTRVREPKAPIREGRLAPHPIWRRQYLLIRSYVKLKVGFPAGMEAYGTWHKQFKFREGKMEFTMSREATETNPDKEKRSPWPRYDAAVLGFHNYWYPALASRRMRHKLLSQKVFGERIVFIRYQGRCYALEDRCAHRGVPLSVGRCEFSGTNTISCRYHGWTYDITNGLCIGAMTDGPDSPIVGRSF